jgi:hypothetical protein
MRDATNISPDGGLPERTPLRARRMILSAVVTTVVGPAMLIASFFVPAAGFNLDGRLRWAGIVFTLVSLRTAYWLLRFARSGTGARRPRRRR